MQSNDTIQTCYQLLQKVLLETFQTETLFFSSPYHNLAKIDRGIRNIMWPDHYQSADSRITPSLEEPDKRFLIIRSNLGFYNILIFLTINEQPDFISIGPFRTEGFSTTYFSQIMKEARVAQEAFQTLSQFYKDLPFAPLQTITNVTKHIIDSFFPEFQNITPLEIEFTEHTHELRVNRDLLSEYSADIAELYQDYLFKLLTSVKSGDSDASSKIMKEFLIQTKLLTTRNLNECKKNLHTLNGHFLLASMSTHVHPIHSLQLYASINDKIENLSGRDVAFSIPNDMCHKYCLLVKNYAFKEYSKTIRSVVNYIHLHLEEDLSLSILAEHFHRNPLHYLLHLLKKSA